MRPNHPPERPHQPAHRPLPRRILAKRRRIQIRRDRPLQHQTRLRRGVASSEGGSVLAAEVVQGELGGVEDALVVDVDHGERGLSGLRVEGFFVGGEDAVDASADAGVGDDDVDERGRREGARGAEEGDLVGPLGHVAFGEVELAGGLSEFVVWVSAGDGYGLWELGDQLFSWLRGDVADYDVRAVV